MLHFFLLGFIILKTNYKRDFMYLEKEAIEYFENYDFNQSFFSKFAIENEGFLTSRKIGSSSEFEEYKEYSTSDNLKDIDWKKYARIKKLLVKQYESYAHLKVNFILDISNSMRFPEKNLLKIEYAKKLIAIFSYLLLKEQNEVFLTTIGSTIRHGLKIQRSNIEEILSSFSEESFFDPKLLLKCNEGIKFLITDCWWGKNAESAFTIIFEKNINLLHLITEEEYEFNYKGNTIFVDSESKKKIAVFDTKEIRENYKKKLTKKIDNLYAKFEENRLYYFFILDNVPYYHNLKKFLDVVR